MAIIGSTRTGGPVQTSAPLGGRIIRASIRRNAEVVAQQVVERIDASTRCSWCGSRAHAWEGDESNPFLDLD